MTWQVLHHLAGFRSLGFDVWYVDDGSTDGSVEMLRRYAVPGRIDVPVPRYRGFHVRPSTLVARIVGHYGSEVVMELEGELYNAGVTLDLFRANEKISAGKAFAWISPRHVSPKWTSSNHR